MCVCWTMVGRLRNVSYLVPDQHVDAALVVHMFFFFIIFFFFSRYPDNYLDVIASKLEFRNRAARWSEERFARFAKLLQFGLSRYFKGGLTMCRLVVAGLTKVLYKVCVAV